MPSTNIETPDWRRDMATILEELNEGVVVVDDQLRVIFANEALTRMGILRSRQSPTVLALSSYFPVFGSPTATIEVVGNTGKLSSEKPNVAKSGEFRINFIERDLANCY